jgi:hypothetical protein
MKKRPKVAQRCVNDPFRKCGSLWIRLFGFGH